MRAYEDGKFVFILFFYDRKSNKCAAISGAYCKILRDKI